MTYIWCWFIAVSSARKAELRCSRDEDPKPHQSWAFLPHGLKRRNGTQRRRGMAEEGSNVLKREVYFFLLVGRLGALETVAILVGCHSLLPQALDSNSWPEVGHAEVLLFLAYTMAC